MEKFDKDIGAIKTAREAVESVEDQVNYSENYSTLLFSRLLHPNIREQLLTVLEENENWLAEKSKQPYYKEDMQDPVTGKFFYDSEGNIEFRQVQVTDKEYVAKTREQLEAELDEGMVTQMSSTNIDFDLLLDKSMAITGGVDFTEGISSVVAFSPAERTAIVGVKNEGFSPLTQQDIQNYSMTESHEKGHCLRKFEASDYLKTLFAPAFNVDAIDSNFIASTLSENGFEVTEDAVATAREVTLHEYLFNFSRPEEIYERMSQLKGYFSMKGDEEFTKQHLDYARKNYLRDGLLNNNMTEFFQAITPETEENFLKLINTVGV